MPLSILQHTTYIIANQVHIPNHIQPKTQDTVTGAVTRKASIVHIFILNKDYFNELFTRIILLRVK